MAPKIAVTAADALEMWDAGVEIRAFQTEGAPERQLHIYGCAFEFVRALITNEAPDFGKLNAKYADLTQREKDTAVSIAKVAKMNGWARMVAEHIHARSPELTIANPNPTTKEA